MTGRPRKPTLSPSTTLSRSQRAAEPRLGVGHERREPVRRVVAFHMRDLDVLVRAARGRRRDRKSTRLNSSHSQISYAVFCLKKKKKSIQRAHSATRSLTAAS